MKEDYMNRSIRMAMVAALSLAMAMSLTACASFSKQSGFLDGYYKDLKPGPEGGAKERWLKPGVDFSKYDKVMLDSVVFYFAPDSDDRGIDPEQMKELSDAFNKELVDALKDGYPIVADPGPGVLRLKFALTGIKQSRPVLSGLTSVVPVGLAISVVKKGTSGSWTGSGATRGEVIAIDPMSNDVIGVAVDEQSAGFTERFSKYGSAKEAFKFWAGRFRVFLDQAHNIVKKQ
jgi:hypothetical protein